MKVKIKEVALKNKSISLYKLAKLMDVSEQTVYAWAKGKAQPSYINLDKLCNVLECGIGDILEAEPVQNKLF